MYSFKTVQKIPASLQQVWDFFSHHANLKQIIQPGIGFTVISRHHGNLLFAGQIIEYRLKPIWGIPIYWMTEITHVKEREYFADEQRRGPYGFWQHQHHFKEIQGGVEMTDIVHYRVPLWFIGYLANALFVRRKLKQIFDYRSKRMEEIFGKWEASA